MMVKVALRMEDQILRGHEVVNKGEMMEIIWERR